MRIGADDVASWAAPLRWSGDSRHGEHRIDAEIWLNPKKIGRFMVGALTGIFLDFVALNA